MNGTPTLFLDQFGSHIFANTVKELRSKVNGGGCRVGKMYVDQKNGSTIHIGYVVGPRWFTAFQRVERAA